MLNKAVYALTKRRVALPIYLIHFITNKCNAKCAHCFYSKSLNTISKNDLSLEEIDHFSKQLGELVWLSFSGGEPFLRGDIDKIYGIYRKNNHPQTFNCPTNGLLSDIIASKTRAMLEQGRIEEFSINLSLDGTAKIHNSMRGINCFDNVLATYDLLIDLKKKYPWLLLKVNTTISNRNIENIAELHEFVRQRMPLINFHSFDILRGNPKDAELKTPALNELINIRPLLHSIWKEYNFFGSNRLKSRIAFNTTKQLYDVSIGILKTNKQPFQCLAGRVHCVLDNNGDIKLCELLPPVGNIRHNSFNEVWHSGIAEKQRKSILERKCACTHLCFQNTNYMLNLKNWPKMFFG